jgi:hypothetical protein
MMIGTRVGMPAFVFDHLIVLILVAMAVVWGMRPASWHHLRRRGATTSF